MFSNAIPIIVDHGVDRIIANIITDRPVDIIQWELLRDTNPHRVGGAVVVVARVRGNQRAFLQSSANASVVLFNSYQRTAEGRFIYRAVAGAEACAALGPKALLDVIRTVARTLIGEVDKIEANYLELYVDLQRTSRPLKPVFDRVSCPARKRTCRERQDAVNAEGRTLRAATWGDQGRRSENISALLYEKPALDPDDWRVAKWRRSGGYVDGKTVRRLEFRIWGKGPLVQMGVNPDFDSLADGGLNAVWDYLTGDWFRVVQKPENKKRRAKTHPWWSRIQALRPLGNAPLLPRDFEPDRDKNLEMAIKQAAGHLRSFAGLTDSDADRSLALKVTLDAAEELLRRAEGGDEDWDDWDVGPGEDLGP